MLLDLNKTRMPFESYHETYETKTIKTADRITLFFSTLRWNCSNAVIVIGVDPFSFYEKNPETRQNNFIFIPIQKECLDAEPACLVTPNFGSAGREALICDGMGMTAGYCFKYKNERNSFQHRYSTV